MKLIHRGAAWLVRCRLILCAATLLLGGASPAEASELSDVDRIAMAAGKGLSIQSLMHMASSAEGGDALSSSDVVRLLRSGVPSAVVWKLTNGRHPSDDEIAASKRDGPKWAPAIPERPRRPPAPRARTEGPFYADGHPYLEYVAESLRMTVAVAVEGKFTYAIVSVTNIGEETFTVFPDLFELETASGMTLRRLDPSEYVDALTRAGSWRTALIAMSAPTATAVSTRSSAVVGVTSGSGRSAVAYGQARSTTGPSTTDTIAAHQYRANLLAEAAAAERSRINSAESAILRAQTLRPGQAIGGVVPFKFRGSAGDEFVLYFSGPPRARFKLHTRQ